MSKLKALKGFTVIVLLYVLLSTGIILGNTGTLDKTSIRDILAHGKASSQILRECDESLDEPITRCICVKKRCEGGYIDSVCLDVCKLGCAVLKVKFGYPAYWVCVAACYASCWVPKTCYCVDYDCVTIYPCNWGN